MTWTATPPTEPGFYWAKLYNAPCIASVEEERGELVAYVTGNEESWRLNDEDFTAWAGPLRPPEDRFIPQPESSQIQPPA